VNAGCTDAVRGGGVGEERGIGTEGGWARGDIDGHMGRPAQPGPSTTRPRHEAARPDVARRTSCSCWAALWADITAQH
jgi:hypothetical protein